MDGRDAMFAIAMNGEPLPARNGYPVRMVVPGLYGYVSATKWVTEHRADTVGGLRRLLGSTGLVEGGPDQDHGPDRHPRKRDHTGEVVVGGMAWAIHKGVSKVQVRVDERRVERRRTRWRPSTTPGSSGCTARPPSPANTYRSVGLRRRRSAPGR